MQQGPRINGNSLNSSHNRKTSQRWSLLGQNPSVDCAVHGSAALQRSCSTWARVAKAQDFGKLESLWITFAGGWPVPSPAQAGTEPGGCVSDSYAMRSQLRGAGRKDPGRTAVSGWGYSRIPLRKALES